MLIFLWRLSLLCGTQRGLFGELILYLIVFYPPLHHRDPPTMFYMAGWLCFCTSQHSGEIKGLFVVCIKSLKKKKVRTFNECPVNMSSFCGFHFHWEINSRITGISFLKTTTGLLSGSTVWILIWMQMLSEDAQRLNQHSALTSAHFLFWRFFFFFFLFIPAFVSVFLLRMILKETQTQGWCRLGSILTSHWITYWFSIRSRTGQSTAILGSTVRRLSP